MAKGLEMDSLLVEMNRILGMYTNNVNMVVQSTIDTTARDAAQKLKSTSPKSEGGGEYAKNWAVKKKNGYAVVYNKAPTYRLTHLLENGHDVVRNGEKVGHAPAHPHIKPVEEWVQEELPARLEDALGNVN